MNLSEPYTGFGVDEYPVKVQDEYLEHQVPRHRRVHKSCYTSIRQQITPNPEDREQTGKSEAEGLYLRTQSVGSRHISAEKEDDTNQHKREPNKGLFVCVFVSVIKYKILVSACIPKNYEVLLYTYIIFLCTSFLFYSLMT